VTCLKGTGSPLKALRCPRRKRFRRCSRLYAGTSENPALLVANSGSENATGADNQQGSPLALRRYDPSEATRRPPPLGRRRYGPGLVATRGGEFALARLSVLDRSLSNSPSEIPCRVIELPEPGVILAINRLITGKPSSYAALQGRRTSEWVIPWEVGSSELDPVTTDRPLWT
jgi:hypothetical protein